MRVMNGTLTTLIERCPSVRWATRAAALLCMMAFGALSTASTLAENAAEQPAAAPPGASTPQAVPASRQATNVAVITIEGPIDAVTAFSVERRMEQAEKGGADCIVFDIDTPGGEVPAVLQITGLIKRSPIQNTVGWINPNAYSGGAYIALACREIVVAPSATMGDAAPIYGGVAGIQQMAPTERAKMLSPLLADIVDSARLRGYDEKLVQGLVILGVELWMIRDKQSGEIFFIDEAEWKHLFDTEPPRGNPRMPSGAAPDAPLPTPTGGTEEDVGPSIGDTTEADRSNFISGSPELPASVAGAVETYLDTLSTRPNFAQADASRYEFVTYATDGRALLTLTEKDLKFFGLAKETIADDAELKQFLGATNLKRLDQTWSESLVAFMTQGVSGLIVRGVLIVVFLIGMFLEMTMPGVGLPGLIAILALAGLFVPPMLIGASAWWALASIVLGLGLIFLEILVIPGFGVPGVLGLGLMLTGLVGSFAGMGEMFPGTSTGDSSSLTWALAAVLVAMFISGVGIYFISRYTHRLPVVNRLILNSGVSRQDTTQLTTLLGAMAPATSDAPVRTGDVGRTTTSLRPSGSALFDDRLVDVVSEFGFVDAGEPVRVTSVSKYRVGVEPMREESAPGSAEGSA